jgi:hypothetical protein
MERTPVLCKDDVRRSELRDHPLLNGIDYIEVLSEPGPLNQRVLNVFFIDKDVGQKALSDMLDDLVGALDKFSVTGGVRIAEVRVTSVERVADHLVVTVNEPGDFSTYTLHIDAPPGEGVPESPSLDPAYAQCDFNFKVDCPTRFDCRPPEYPSAELGEAPPIDYMAKDYASFRQALIDLIPTLYPDWRERHAADLGMTLIELLAYAADHLSYFQDAVANEAFLDTARQRISVRRHARLIDYKMNDGVSARAFVYIGVKAGTTGRLPEGSVLLTELDVILDTTRPPHPSVIAPEHGQDAIAGATAAFETVTRGRLHYRLNRMDIHTWGSRECCVPEGATRIDLSGRYDDLLEPGDFLLLEEVKGPTGEPERADPLHRQVVRLTSVELLWDPLKEDDVTRVEWDVADALTFPLCISMRSNGDYIAKMSIARGNLVLADHGRRIVESHERPPAEGRRRSYRFSLAESPVGFSMALPTAGEPARSLLQPEDPSAGPSVALSVDTGDATDHAWEPRDNLLDSEPFDAHFTVETDDIGRAVLRFGDGEFGAALPEGAGVTASYRVGIGPSGNVGADSIVHVVRPFGALASWPDVSVVRNPLPAWGGTEPESVERVKTIAPAAFHATQLRAVTEDDYARIAERHPGVARAVADFRWTGSWHTVFVTVDPRGGAQLTPALRSEVLDWISGFAQTGYDLEIDPPVFVPLELEIEICVRPDHFKADVEQELLRRLSSRTLSGASLGFFHPDKFTFGQPLYLSALYAAIEAVEGVDSATVLRVTRRNVPDPDPDRPATKRHVESGRVEMGRLEVLRVDTDPNFPENGTVTLIMRGGK